MKQLLSIEPRGVDTLPPFDQVATCPKCGHDQVKVRHHAEYTGYCPLTSATEPPPGGSLYDRWKREWDREHFDRTCERCGFGWAERVLA